MGFEYDACLAIFIVRAVSFCNATARSTDFYFPDTTFSLNILKSESCSLV